MVAIGRDSRRGRGLRSILAALAALATFGASGQPLTQNFDDITTLAGAGWVLTNNSAPAGTTGWFQGNTAVFSSQAGAADSYIAANFNNAAFGGNVSNWLLTPALTGLQNGETLTFYTRSAAAFPDSLEVRLCTAPPCTDVGATDTSLGSFTTLLLAVNPTQAAAGYPAAWTQFSVVLSGLPAGPNAGRIGFRYVVTDTSVNGDYIGIDTFALTGPPDLAITKAHVGNFAQGQIGATYTITVTNVGTSDTSGTVTMVDTLPAGLAGSGLAGTGWACIIATLTCTRSDVLTPAASYPPITLTVNVSASAPASVVNTATVSGGGDANAANNVANDTTIISAGPDLTILKSHVGTFTQGQTGAPYTITVTNSGATPTSGTVTVVDTLPAALTATAISGPGWACTLGTLTCTRSDALAPASSYPAITLTVNVSAIAPVQVTNTATVSGGGEVNGANNSAADVTNIQAGSAPATTNVIPTLNEWMLVLLVLVLGSAGILARRRKD